MPEDYYDRPRRATADNLGLGSEIAAGLSFLSPVMGAVGIGSNILSWILGNDKYDWNKWAAEQKTAVAANYDASLKKMEQKTANLADATIGQATNTQGMAGGVAGISSAGTGRLQAQTYANIAGQRDQAIASITNAMENQKANALAAVDKAAYQGSMAEDFNAPTTLDYASNFVKSLQAGPAQDFLGTLFGGGYLGIKSLFQNGGTTNPKTTNTSARYSNYMQGGRRFNDDYGEGVVDVSQSYRNNTPLDIMNRIGMGNNFEFSPFGKDLYETLNTNFDLTPESLFNRYNKMKGK